VIDWSALGGNPVPGDPAGIRASAARVSAAGDTVRFQSRLLRAVSTGGTSAWRGPAAAAFRSLADGLDPDLQTMVIAHRDAAAALDAFAAELEAFQASAQLLLGQARQALRESSEAGSRIAAVLPQLDAAAIDYNEAASTPPPVGPHAMGPVPDPALEAASGRLAALRGELATAQLQAHQAHQAHQEACRRAAALHAQATVAAERCAARLRQASGGAGRLIARANDWASGPLTAWGAWGAFVTSRDGLLWAGAAAAAENAKMAFQQAMFAFADGTSGWLALVRASTKAKAAEGAADAAEQTFDGDVFPGSAGDVSSLATNLGRVGLGLGMAADAATMVDPGPAFGPGHGFGGEWARGVSAANFAASGVALGASMSGEFAAVLLDVPFVNVVVAAVLVGTAVYFTGEFIYQHWDTIADAVDDAGRWAGRVADDVGHVAGDAVRDLDPVNWF